MPKLKDAYAELASEHEHLMALVDRIRRHAEARDPTPLLEQLHESLIEHFSHEQFPGGLYECMGAYDPAHHAELEVLIGEHCTILSNARGLLERSRAAPPAGDPELRDGIGELVDMLYDHEHREHRLASRLLGRAD